MKLKVLAVWEPVLAWDIAPPTASKLARLSDRRVEQFWDKDRLLSRQLLESARAHPERLAADDAQHLAAAKVVWDYVAFFPKGARWIGRLPFPAVHGYPVIRAAPQIDRALAGLSH